MAIILLSLYQASTGAWYARLQNDATGQIAELKYRSRPTQAQARADVVAVFNPPTANVTGEDGVTVALPLAVAGSISLTPTQRTAIANAETTISAFVDRVVLIWPTLDEGARQTLRIHSPLLDNLISIAERVR